MKTRETKGLGALAIMILAWSTAACGSSVILDADGDGIPDDEDGEVTPPGGAGASGPGGAPACAPGSNRTEIAPWEKASDYIAVHDGWVYWTTQSTIERAPQTGGGPVELLLAPNGRPMGIDVDDSGIYFAADDGVVQRIGLDGGAATTLAANIGIGGAFSVVRVDDGHAYFRLDCGHLARVPKGQGAIEVVAETQGCFGGLALDDDAIYFVDSSDGRVAKVAKEGGPAETLVTGASAKAGGYSGAANGIAVDDDTVYWTSSEGGFVGSVPKTGGVMQLVAGGLDLLEDVAVADGLVYWSEMSMVGRASADGEDRLVLTDEPLSIVPMGLAIDGDRLFFTNYVSNGAVLSVCR